MKDSRWIEVGMQNVDVQKLNVTLMCLLFSVSLMALLDDTVPVGVADDRNIKYV